jgi:hypothetical protein
MSRKQGSILSGRSEAEHAQIVSEAASIKAQELAAIQAGIKSPKRGYHENKWPLRRTRPVANRRPPRLIIKINHVCGELADSRGNLSLDVLLQAMGMDQNSMVDRKLVIETIRYMRGNTYFPYTFGMRRHPRAKGAPHGKAGRPRQTAKTKVDGP